MTETIRVSLRFFGAFRRYEGQGKIFSLVLPKGSTAAVAREKLIETLVLAQDGFSDHALVMDSALASDEKIIGLDEKLEQDCTLAVLPPVCGG